jgi:two-component system sensor histidine kinase/response regulator
MTTARVLIVDDDSASLDALEQMLRLRFPTLQVEACLSGLNAMERISSIAFDAVLADVAMPGMDGLQLLACIRKRRPHTPILLMTGHGDQELARRALREGAYAYIEKPLDRDYLVRALASAIEGSPAPRQPEHEH